MLMRSALRSCLLALLITHVVATHYRRQLLPSGGPDDDDDQDPPVQSSTSSSSSSTLPSQSSSIPPSSASSEAPSSTPPPPPETSAPPLPGPSSPSASAEDPVTVSGSVVTIVVPPSRSGPSGTGATPSDAAQEEDDDGSSEGLGTGPIVGMSVAGGLAVIGLIAFFVWKFTRKRFSTFDDNEPIKWPDLNSHGGADSHPLPVRDTGRAGFETGSENSLSRVNSGNYSNVDFQSHQDPYAVPPLPHLNPNQPYRDDPTSAAGFYDPYRGPVPPSVEHGQDWQGEAIPMNQIHGGAGYDQQQPPYNGRQSPGPLQAYDAGRASPAPPNMGAYQPQTYDHYDQQGVAGRQSPGPMAAYGGGNAGYNAAGYSPQPPSYAPR